MTIREKIDALQNVHELGNLRFLLLNILDDVEREQREESGRLGRSIDAMLGQDRPINEERV